MPILFACPACSTPLRVADDLEGKPIKCPRCGGVTTAIVPPATAVGPSPAIAEAPREEDPVWEIDLPDKPAEPAWPAAHDGSSMQGGNGGQPGGHAQGDGQYRLEAGLAIALCASWLIVVTLAAVTPTPSETAPTPLKNVTSLFCLLSFGLTVAVISGSAWGCPSCHHWWAAEKVNKSEDAKVRKEYSHKSVWIPTSVQRNKYGEVVRSNEKQVTVRVETTITTTTTTTDFTCTYCGHQWRTNRVKVKREQKDFV
jgi:hypothetical protein